MCKSNVPAFLSQEIAALRDELENLLETENFTSEAVLEISRKLDRYITKYYML